MLLMIDGESGGVGKSTFTRLLLEYFRLKRNPKFPYLLFDLDLNKSDVGSVYAPDIYGGKVEAAKVEVVSNEKSEGFALTESNDNNTSNSGESEPVADLKIDAIAQRLVRFTDDKQDMSKIDVLFELALETTVIASLPSNIKTSLDTWMINSGVVTLAEQLDFHFIKFFVITEDKASVDLFVETANSHRGQGINHVLVYNPKTSNTTLDEVKQANPSLVELLEDYQTSDLPEIETLIMPSIDPNYYRQVLSADLTIEEAVKSKNSGLSIIARQSLKKSLVDSSVDIHKLFKRLDLDLVNPGAKKALDSVEIDLDILAELEK